jgi:DNA-binding GntR family transcriptional regulator
VTTIPFRGAFVHPFDETEILEVYEIRAIIELAALVKVMPSPPAKRVAALGQILERIRAALTSGDQAGYLSADTDFHRTIVELAGNERLTEMFTTLAEQGKCFMLGRTHEAMEKYKDGNDDHVGLFEAIRNGQTDEAIRLLTQHVRVTPEEVRRLMPGY